MLRRRSFVDYGQREIGKRVKFSIAAFLVVARSTGRNPPEFDHDVQRLRTRVQGHDRPFPKRRSRGNRRDLRITMKPAECDGRIAPRSTG